MRHYYVWGGGPAFASMYNDAYTKLLIHSNTTNNSTTFTDSSASAHTITAEGDAKHVTAFQKWGTTSFITGTTFISDYLSIPDHADFTFGDNAFTLDLWVNFASGSLTEETVFYRQEKAGGSEVSLSTPDYIEFGSTYTSSQFKFFIRRYYTSGGQQFDPNFTYNFNPVAGRWYHVAFIRGWGGNANSWQVTVNGEQLRTAQTSTVTVDNYTEVVKIRSRRAYFDELRITNGVARWTTPFKPPAGPYS